MSDRPSGRSRLVRVRGVAIALLASVALVALWFLLRSKG